MSALVAADLGAADRGRGMAVVDGTLMPLDAVRVSPLDHGYLYGDGLFETLRVYDGRLFRLEAHLERLEAGVETLEIAGVPSRSTLADWAQASLDATGLTEAACRITVTRGIGLAGLDPVGCERATVVVASVPLRVPAPHVYERGAKATLLWPRHPEDRPPLTVKSTSYQRAVLASLEARRRGADTGFYLDLRGHVTEAISANVFAVVGDHLVTPPTGECLAGVTRAEVLSIAAELGLRTEMAALPVDLFARANEVFVTSSLAEIVPVSMLDERPVGSGAPGPVTGRLREAFRARTRES